MDYEGSKEQSHQKKSSDGKLTSLGLCLGASTVSIVQLEQNQNPKTYNPTKRNNNPRIIKSSLYPHEGDPKRTLLRLINDLDLNEFDRIVATGRQIPLVCQSYFNTRT